MITEKPEEGEAFDDELCGKHVRMETGETGVVVGRASSCYNPYEIRIDATGKLRMASVADFTVLD